MNWNKLDMSDDGILYRARMKAPATLFDSHEEEIIVGWVIYQDLALISSTSCKLREYVLHKITFHYIYINYPIYSYIFLILLKKFII